MIHIAAVVERMARLLIEQDEAPDCFLPQYRRRAWALIDVMREPTADMLDIGADTITDMASASPREIADAVWSGMIQALLPDEMLK